MTLLLFVVTCSVDINAGTDDCRSIPTHQSPDSKNSVALELDWKRAIDRDDAEDLWRLMPDTDVSVVNGKGKNALMSAAKLGDHCLFATLIDKGLRIQDRSYTGGTALMYAVLGNELTMVNTLLPLTADIDAQSTNGWTALMIAAAKGFDDAIKLLLDAGANPRLADVYQWSPLMRAIDNRHDAVVERLLLGDAIDINRTNENGSSVLHIATTVGDVSLVKRLVKLGVDVSLRDKSGYTAEQIAREKGYSELVTLLGG